MHRTLAHGLLLAAASSWALSGCGANPGDAVPERVGAAEEAIAGGYIDDADKAVVGIFDGQIGSICSGSLLAPNVVLTARHCVSSVLNEVSGGVSCNETTFGSLHSASGFYVTTHTQMEYDPSLYHRAREVIGLPVSDKSFCGNDQAILILDENIDPNEALPLTPRVDTAIAPGDEYFAVGFGATNDSGSGAGTRRRRDSLFIDCVADGCPKYYTRPTEWIGDKGICSGDSGGPALDMLGRVIGVTSRGPSGCEDPVYGYVFGWGQWIKDVTNYAAGLGGYPPPIWASGWPTDPAYSNPVGAACSQATDCPSNWCIDDGQGAGLYCTRLCNAAAPCDAGFYCDEGKSNACIRQPVQPDPTTTPDTTKKKANEGTATDDSGGCTIHRDPTKPIPWFAGLVSALFLARRRRR
jgi:hypothetical protein